MKTKQIEFNGKFFNARIIKDRNDQELIIAGLDQYSINNHIIV